MVRRSFYNNMLMAVIGLFFTLPAFAESNYNLPRGVTPISREIFDLHMIIFWICVGIGILVFGFITYTLIFHRKSRGVVAAKFHDHATVEIVWAVIPFLILIAMAIPATIVLIRMTDTRYATTTVEITGYQWKWKYQYLNEGISFFSNLATPKAELENKAPKNPNYLRQVDNPLVLPTHEKIRFLVTSNDVVHSWWVPALGVKRDAIPGFIHEAWAYIEKPGVYYGQCAELCGMHHGYMPIVVVAKTPQDYAAWVKQQQAAQEQAKLAGMKPMTKAELMTRGQAVYEKTCAVCHQANGMGIPNTFPALKGSKIATGPVQNHLQIVLHGKQGTTMQAFGGQLSDTDIAAVITYERNAWGNNTGDLVQPKDVAAAKQASAGSK